MWRDTAAAILPFRQPYCKGKYVDPCDTILDASVIFGLRKTVFVVGADDPRNVMTDYDKRYETALQ